MAGEPLGEPVAHYWPFVMNTEEDIQQAMRDYNAGKFERK
jgi:redox-sensitive bicupin YhaK (pirin superfamily)